MERKRLHLRPYVGDKEIMMERKRLHLRPYVGDKEINDH